MTDFDQELNIRLEAIQEQGLYRELRRVDSPQGTRVEIAGKSLLNFSSNDYLGLAAHTTLKEAAIRAVESFGAGSGASRLICGSIAPHHELEETIAAFKGTEAALSFSSGYATAIGTLYALMGKDDVVIVDKLVHACIVDAAKLCGAKLRVFDHNDLNDLEDILKWADSRSRNTQHVSRVLVVTESVFSMDGDHAPLREIVALKEKYGAWLMLDEAHAAGLYGDRRRGLAENLQIGDQVEIQMGTLGKAFGSSGGFICGSRALIDLLINRARSFIFSTAPVPAAAAAATAAIRLVQSAEGESLCKKLWHNVDGFASDFGLRTSDFKSAIIPIIIGLETKAVEAANALRSKGIFVPAIRYPTVARGSARLRVTLTAAHNPEDVAALTNALHALRITPHGTAMQAIIDSP
jgi:8-amino-7-oxononanoate synthase